MQKTVDQYAADIGFKCLTIPAITIARRRGASGTS
jgi:hypothetical protein